MSQAITSIICVTARISKTDPTRFNATLRSSVNYVVTSADDENVSFTRPNLEGQPSPNGFVIECKVSDLGNVTQTEDNSDWYMLTFDADKLTVDEAKDMLRGYARTFYKKEAKRLRELLFTIENKSNEI
jgi:hypothetical protein